MDSARKGDEVCVKIDAVPGEAPKLYGRHFDDTDLLISRVSHLRILKGLSHEVDLNSFKQICTVLGLTKRRGWFLNCIGAPMIL